MQDVPDGGLVVEIGSWTGGSGSALARGIRKWCPKALLHCVDPFDMDYFNTHKGLVKKMHKYSKPPIEVFKERMKPYRYQLIRMKSEDAVEQFEDGTVDFVFIDGNHDYEYVKRDIQMWRVKLKDDGIMCGHDFGKPGVTRAVNELCKGVKLVTETMWAIRK